MASDMIAREVQLLKEAGKPVVACMGDVAASGGYYIAGGWWLHVPASCRVKRNSNYSNRRQQPAGGSSAYQLGRFA